ncbi:glycine cleavage system aminomethyltransferase GcvT [Methylobacterium sp. E-041]|uniref:glycine cleavage system aminomethyltransferase GcvT n=2 Tax=unclassified Methylobacterium TaxID=2615210 RepID=UPI0011C75FDA|nr:MULTISPECIES: glycine cleavage system aminomethyltransferase GcvT [unclassified Methylobacterium]MCJ2106793.1 glycine cleavage system aminomethyltransferase GcvT [Methylobacterium sp. E-041]TXN49926.1 glycine cleavage system aminomethyltransferase GcvT [Methylobacterium sp. WL119]TXN66089.1 glycine cleavage system aminomethyltransferase GcvT [Methylobacterium sp. WL30]
MHADPLATVDTPRASGLLRNPLHALHLRRGARMVPFSGYDMPLHYPAGLLKEHIHTRANAGLFDVSHMGQIALAADDPAEAARALEALIPADIVGLKPGRQRYGLLTDAAGGIRDDLMVGNLGDRLVLVVNAANKAADLAHLRAYLPAAVTATALDRALIALQGPKAEAALARIAPQVAAMRFMDAAEVPILGHACLVTRSGYTGEDGFEISLPDVAAEAVAEALLADAAVMPIGLGARDSLRLEAGLCLHGADIGPDTSPVEAGLAWAIPSVRRIGGARAGGFPGDARILAEIAAGPSRRRVGLRPEGRSPVRAGAPLFAEEAGTEPVGTVTSGGFGPSLGAPAAMAMLPVALGTDGTRVFAEVRGQRLPVRVVPLPFVPAGFKRGRI